MSSDATINGSFKDDNSGATLDVWTVTFDSDGGKEVPPQVRPTGATAIRPDDPTKADYFFGGWYDNNGLLWDFNTSVTTDLKLTAEWTSKDAHYKETETVTAAVVVTQSRTCTLDELSTYTAVFTNKAFATQTEENVKTADKLGHNFRIQSDGETQHFSKCSRCGATGPKENHTGGTATSTEKAECAVCHAKYGEIDQDNHSELEEVDEVPATAEDTVSPKVTPTISPAGGDDTNQSTVEEEMPSLETESTDARPWKIVAAAVLGIICVAAAVVVLVLRKRKTTETD